MFSKPVASYEVIVWKQSPCRGPAKLALRIMKLKRLAVNLKADVWGPANTPELCQKTPRNFFFFEENVSNRGEWTWAQCDSWGSSVTFFLTGTLLNNFLLFNSHYSEQFIIQNSLLTRFWGETSPHTWFEGFSPCWWRSWSNPVLQRGAGGHPLTGLCCFFHLDVSFSHLCWCGSAVASEFCLHRHRSC